MCNRNYDVYKNIISACPKIDAEYLAAILHLAESESIRQVDISEVVESNTALVIRVSVFIISGCQEYIRKLFIKTSKSDNTNNSYHEMSMKEGSFYEFLLSHSNADVPVSACYDVFISEMTGEFVIMLEDLSERYKAPNNIDLSDTNTWFSCAESLARFHGAFWNDSQIGKGKLSVKNEQEIESETLANREYLNTFLKEFNDRFDEKTIKIYEHAMSINNKLIREQNQSAIKRNNITICNGDSHIYNFMLSPDSAKPVMVDFQFWGKGYGVGDLAHLTRVNFPDEFKKNIQLSLVKRYHEALLEHGVVDYSWENCINDYRKEVATMVLIPMWQYCCFGLKYEEWIGEVKGLIDNYKYMECHELYTTE
jgi:hypothetical protein